MSVIKPLCRKRFLANTIIDMDWLLRELDRRHPTPRGFGSQYAQRGVKSLEQSDHTFFATEIWKLSNQFYDLALDQRTDWGRFEGLRGDIYSPKSKPRIGSIVYVMDAGHYKFYDNAVGQLIRIEREPRRYGGNRLYEDDGGPVHMSEQYVLRLLDGTEFRWYNATIGFVPSSRPIQMWKKIVGEVYDDTQFWKA